MTILTKEQFIKKKLRRKRINRIIKITLLVLILMGVAFSSNINKLFDTFTINTVTTVTTLGNIDITQMFLTPNEYSRPQDPLKKVNSIVIHYTGNPSTTAKANRNYFENLAIKQNTYASSHYVVGLDGEIIQCLPLNEVSFASNHRNFDTISIETCHPDEGGKFGDKTYESLVALVASLCEEFNLGREDIIRHYDVTGKKCPLYYVDNPEAWEQLKDDIMNYISDNKKL